VLRRRDQEDAKLNHAALQWMRLPNLKIIFAIREDNFHAQDDTLLAMRVAIDPLT
jgi:hypothetical protein